MVPPFPAGNIVKTSRPRQSRNQLGRSFKISTIYQASYHKKPPENLLRATVCSYHHIEKTTTMFIPWTPTTDKTVSMCIPWKLTAEILQVIISLRP